MPLIPSKLTASGMLREGTPVQDYRAKYRLWVKREDLACPPPGPAFSKARGVWARVQSRPEPLIGVLDTRHSQAGHAVARACQILGKRCVNYYPEFKHEPGPKPPQLSAQALGAELHGLPAGRSAILFHQAKKLTEFLGGYMMPNALKLFESVEETAKEVTLAAYANVIIPVSSGTIAAGVIRGFSGMRPQPRFILHLGYSRSAGAVVKYVEEASGVTAGDWVIIDEGYSYADVAVPGPTPPWPCNEYYDLKAFRWWERNRLEKYPGETLFWNIG